MTNSNWTGRTARTTDEALGCTGFAGYAYRTPLYKRALFALMRWGWLVVFLAVILLSGCDEMDSQERSAADLRDAIQQARGWSDAK